MPPGAVFPVAFGLLLAAGLPAVVRAQASRVMPKPGYQHGWLVHQGRTRSFLLRVPPAVRQSRELPLVVVLHGGGGSGRAAARLTRFSALADGEGFVVAYPDGVNRHWNDGRGVERFRAQREDVDDVGFLAALVDTVAGQFGLDRTRVYATGISNGAMMCYRLALEASDRFCAVAPVAGAMPESLGRRAGPERPVSVLAISGTLDPLVPWQGGGVGLRDKRGRVMSVPASIGFWQRANGCAGADTAWLEDRDQADGMRVWRERYTGGRDGSEVVLYGVKGGGHTWPGGGGRPRAFGRRTDDIDATRVIWEFFSRRRR